MAETTEKAEPVAWRYELAQRGWSDADYGDWRWHVSCTEPRVPKGSIRNLTPLYEDFRAARPRCDAQSEALDNSQSLLVMMIELSREGSIPPRRWINEGLSRLLEEQVGENRRALSETKPEDCKNIMLIRFPHTSAEDH